MLTCDLICSGGCKDSRHSPRKPMKDSIRGDGPSGPPSPTGPDDMAPDTELNLAIVRRSQQDTQERLRNLQSIVVQLASQQERGTFLQTRDWIILALVLCLQTLLQYIFSKRYGQSTRPPAAILRCSAKLHHYSVNAAKCGLSDLARVSTDAQHQSATTAIAGSQGNKQSIVIATNAGCSETSDGILSQESISLKLCRT